MSKFDFNKVAKQNINMDILVIGTSTQFLLRGFMLKQNFKKINLLLVNSILCDMSILYSPFYMS